MFRPALVARKPPIYRPCLVKLIMIVAPEDLVKIGSAAIALSG